MDKETLLEFLKTRRSIRKFKPDPIPKEYVEAILEAGRWAPSGDNAQSWRFIVVTNPEKIKILGQLGGGGSGRRFKAEYVSGHMEERLTTFKTEETRHRVYRRLISGSVSAFVSDAPVVIVVCSRLDCWDPPLNISTASQNILLMAHALGLGACWLEAPTTDIRDEYKVKKLLNVPAQYTIFHIIAIGYPGESPGLRFRLELSEFSFWNEWGKAKELE